MFRPMSHWGYLAFFFIHTHTFRGSPLTPEGTGMGRTGASPQPGELACCWYSSGPTGKIGLRLRGVDPEAVCFTFARLGGSRLAVGVHALLSCCINSINRKCIPNAGRTKRGGGSTEGATDGLPSGLCSGGWVGGCAAAAVGQRHIDTNGAQIPRVLSFLWLSTGIPFE